jgi:hypothetical protein
MTSFPATASAASDHESARWDQLWSAHESRVMQRYIVPNYSSKVPPWSTNDIRFQYVIYSVGCLISSAVGAGCRSVCYASIKQQLRLVWENVQQLQLHEQERVRKLSVMFTTNPCFGPSQHDYCLSWRLKQLAAEYKILAAQYAVHSYHSLLLKLAISICELHLEEAAHLLASAAEKLSQGQYPLYGCSQTLQQTLINK